MTFCCRVTHSPTSDPSKEVCWPTLLRKPPINSGLYSLIHPRLPISGGRATGAFASAPLSTATLRSI